jgi:serine/threonine protein phosphatase PrpC
VPHVITLNQETDTPARRERIGKVMLTYLYDRSRDSQQAGARGQDFIAFCGDEKRLAFAICDGVSQSFYGDLAARFLGEKLVAWLTELPFPVDSESFRHALSAQLAAWQPEAAALVAAHPIRADLPPMLRQALLQKRENGSESMFLAVLIDHEAHQFAACWMGDLRLRLFDAHGEELHLPEAHWDTRQRWSSRLGAKHGAPQVLLRSLDGVARLTAHSDGFGSRADMLKRFTLDSLNALADELLSLPASDDLSLLDVALQGVPTLGAPLETPVPYLVPDEPALCWQPVAGATWYRVWLEGEGRAFTADLDAVEAPSFVLKVHGLYTCRVQALSNDHLPSALSAPLRLENAPVTEAVITRQAEPTRLKPITVKKVDAEPVSAPAKAVPPAAVPAPAEPFAWRLLTAVAAAMALGLSVVWYLVYMR